jgi:hypothetical protein
MFGMSRDDASQQGLAAKYREGFMPYRGGYALKPSHTSDPIQITEQQREQLVQAYCAAYRRSMRVLFPLLLLAVGVTFVISIALGRDVPEGGIMLMVFALIGSVLLWQRSAMRRAIAALGPRPSVLGTDYAEWQRQRWRDRPWSSILLPAFVAPVIFLRWHTHLPPRDVDDCFALVFIAGFVALILAAIARKLSAKRG